MKIIKIKSPKYGDFNVLIDDEDYDLVKAKKWHIQKAENRFYAVSCKYLSKINGKTLNEYTAMHKIIMPCGVGLEIDHKDGSGINNQKGNLRICTHSQNAKNKLLSADNTSGYNGVCNVFNTTDKIWKARIRVNGKEINGGFFKTPQEAAIRYNELATIYFGEFAKLNII